MTRRGFYSKIAVSAMIAALWLVAGCSQGGHEKSQSGILPAGAVQTTYGPVRGVVDSDVTAFQGIPYAAPPVGRLRWQPPQQPPAWSSPRDAQQPSPACPQPDRTTTSEDCLYLNVYAPTAAPRTGLPVIVFLHGGSFTTGAGSDIGGRGLSSRGGVVVVTLNYRLGPLGFLALPAMKDQSGAGNFGILDQQAALRWVADNISRFGGDPRLVTLMGESAGGASVCLNYVSPAARGLFHRAIAESGCAQEMRTRQAADEQGDRIARAVGCPSGTAQLACLRSRPPAALIRQATVDATGHSSRWDPVVGTPLLPQRTLDALAAGDFAPVPMLQGVNHDEGGLFVSPFRDSKRQPLRAQQYSTVVAKEFGPLGPAVAAEYPVSRFATPGQALAAAVGDGTFACRAAIAQDRVSARARTYAYEFADPNAPATFAFDASYPLGAYHGAEVQFLLPWDEKRFSPAQRQLSDLMIKYWVSFARTGDPNGAGRPRWPEYSPGGQTMTLAPTRVAAGGGFASEHSCSFWKNLID